MMSCLLYGSLSVGLMFFGIATAAAGLSLVHFRSTQNRKKRLRISSSFVQVSAEISARIAKTVNDAPEQSRRRCPVYLPQRMTAEIVMSACSSAVCHALGRDVQQRSLPSPSQCHAGAWRSDRAPRGYCSLAVRRVKDPTALNSVSPSALLSESHAASLEFSVTAEAAHHSGRHRTRSGMNISYTRGPLLDECISEGGAAITSTLAFNLFPFRPFRSSVSPRTSALFAVLACDFLQTFQAETLQPSRIASFAHQAALLLKPRFYSP